METTTHNCGGTILTGGSDEHAHLYCDSCGAFTYDMDGTVPGGTDAAANKAAWDTGDEQSPDQDAPAAQVGARIGRAIARDVIAEDMPRGWTVGGILGGVTGLLGWTRRTWTTRNSSD